MILGLGHGISKFHHVRWGESLDHFKLLVRDNPDGWIQEFQRAIDIYTGKIKGFKDVPEE